jgi:succinate dehydrogenase/fumarate reductase flavoprotein subunit
METHRCDVLVIGSGAAALTAAVTARLAGLDVLVCEKAATIGGASARSGGWLWIPGNRHMAGMDGAADRAAAKIYIRGHAGEHFDARRVVAFLEKGPEMVDFLEANTHVRFAPLVGFPDYHPGREGASQGGRSIIAEAFDAHILGEDRARLTPPLAVATWAGMMVSVPELDKFQRAGRSLSAAAYVGRRLLRQLWDRLRHGVTMRLANGNALVGRLVATARDLGLPIWTSAAAVELLLEGSKAAGAVVEKDGRRITIRAARGVVVGTGGFAHDRGRRETLLPWARGRDEPFAVLPSTQTGDGQRLAESAGAVFSTAVQCPIALGPVTPFDRPVGGLRGFPHLGGRAKPGVIAVTGDGSRFANEADSYHDFGLGLLAAAGAGEPTAWLITDGRAMVRYGFGYAKPFPLPLRPYLRSGYLKRGGSVAELAAAIGVDSAALQQTFDRYNDGARRGEDPDFGRGSNRYNAVQGDREVTPNPCVAPMVPPFYAVKVTAGALGTFAGISTDEHARALRADGSVVEGLYVVGNDMLSVLGGDYVGGGSTLGPGMTFGYVAGRHLAECGIPPRERP